MTATGSATNWRSAAACRSADPDLFFPIAATGPAERQIARAKTICARCPVRQECLEFALGQGLDVRHLGRDDSRGPPAGPPPEAAGRRGGGQADRRRLAAAA